MTFPLNASSPIFFIPLLMCIGNLYLGYANANAPIDDSCSGSSTSLRWLYMNALAPMSTRLAPPPIDAAPIYVIADSSCVHVRREYANAASPIDVKLLWIDSVSLARVLIEL